MDEDGEILKEEKFENSLLGVEEFFRDYEDVEVVIEACYSWKPTLERLGEFGVGGKPIFRLIGNFDLFTGKRSNSNKPSFSLEELDEIQEAIIDSLCLERFILN